MDEFRLEELLSVTAHERLQDSAIASISALREKHECISFSAGEPDSAFYPTEELKRAFSLALDDAAILNYYHDDMGYVPLREWLAAWMRSEGTAPDWVSAKNILLTHGGAEGLNDMAELFLEEGRCIAVEEASYVEALMCFRKQGAVCCGVPMDEDGIIPAALDRACAERGVRLLYTIPCFQNPTGITASAERRREILAVCERRGVLIIEDDPYRCLNYDGPVPPTYLSLAGDSGCVIYCSSFSKVIAPGMRMGWLVLPDSVVKRFESYQICGGLIQQPLTHRAMHIYLENSDISKRVEYLRGEYKKRRDSLVRELTEQAAPLGLRVNRPSGGFFLWGSIDGVSDMDDFARRAIINHGISFIPGESFVVSDSLAKNLFRMSLSKVTPALAKEGCARLCAAIRSY